MKVLSVTALFSAPDRDFRPRFLGAAHSRKDVRAGAMLRRASDKPVMVKIDQQVQYRVGTIEFLGVDSMTREKLSESLPKPGEVFDSTKLNEFFKVNRAILPSDVSKDDVSVWRDPKARTVAILLDFWTCP